MLNSDFSLLNINNLIIELLNFRITGSKKILFARLLKFSSATHCFSRKNSSSVYNISSLEEGGGEFSKSRDDRPRIQEVVRSTRNRIFLLSARLFVVK